MTTETSTSRRGRRAQRPTPVQAADTEGLLDRRLLDVDPARWPSWARARYGVAQPVGEPVEPLTVDESDR